MRTVSLVRSSHDPRALHGLPKFLDVKPDKLRAFPVLFPWRMAWGDMDAFQHLNNCMYLKYFEHARVDFFERIGLNFATGPTAQPSGSISVIIGSVSAKFKRPVTYPDDILVGTRVAKIDVERGDFDLEHAMWSATQKAVVATGVSGCVAFNYQSQKRSPIPAEWLECFREMEKVVEKPPHL